MKGKDKILLVRRLDEATTKNAIRPLYQIEHEWSYERDTDSEQTKDGAVPKSGGLQVSLTMSGLASKDETNDFMLKAVEDGAILEFWDVNLANKNSEGKYAARYARGMVSSWTEPSNVEDLIEVETEATIEGKPVKGFATVPENIVEEASYAFADTTPVKAPAE